MLMPPPSAGSKRSLNAMGPAAVPRERAGAELGSLSALLRTQKHSTFPARHILFREGDNADSIFLLIAGAVRLYRFMPNGRRMLTRFIFPQEMIGLGFGETCPFTAEAIKPITTSRICRSQLSALCARSPGLQNEILVALRQELSTAHEDLLPMMHQNAEARIARLLTMLARRGGADIRNGMQVHLAMPRADIADYLGLTIETVCRGFAKLKSDCLISAISPDEIRIEDAHSLIALAAGES